MSGDPDVRSTAPFREAVIDLAVIRSNVEALRAHLTATGGAGVRTMAVVKANAYGHGAVPVARAALAGGADWLGVADIEEGIALRKAGIDAPVLAWLHDPTASFAEAISVGIDIGISSTEQLRAVAEAARTTGSTGWVQLKLDTGLSRNGIPAQEWVGAFRLARALRSEGVVVRGIFSHLANASAADDAEQRAAYERGLALAADEGLRPELTHLAATAAALARPDTRFSMVRIGIGIYGLSPWGNGFPAGLGLTPAMTLRGRVAAVRRVTAGAGASYGLAWRTPRDTTLALVPLGYADGIPRRASDRASVSIDGTRHPIVGRIAMDQFIVDVGDAPVRLGDTVVLFGNPATGVPSAEEWAEAADTINYEIVTRIGSRVPRSYRGE
ncbi:alanine racemase [Luethyella okanaganae]|uniref:Alanine racemase n=1 Tax=Luethyella okanaganae TaxID=69372 RepID=A0ABW1VJK5_9MICO